MVMEERVAKIRVFISFDYDNDLDLKNLLVGQAANPDSPFEIADWSVKAVAPDWREDATRRICRAEEVAVICGQHTDTAAGVNVEPRIAQTEQRPYFLLAAHASGMNKRPGAAVPSDKLYDWTWDNLKRLVAGQR
jgi:hypothetical protein